jgi:hypothetical protein
MMKLLTKICRYLIIRRAFKIIKSDGNEYRSLKCKMSLCKRLRDKVLIRWSECNEDDDGYFLYVELCNKRSEYYVAVSNLLAWRNKYKKFNRNNK